MTAYSGKYVDTLADNDRLFLLPANAVLKRGECIFINTVPFRVRHFELQEEGLLVQVASVADPD